MIFIDKRIVSVSYDFLSSLSYLVEKLPMRITRSDCEFVRVAHSNGLSLTQVC